MDITKEEKKATRRSWRFSVIIKLIGKTIGYHYLLRRVQSTWKPQAPITLIDLSNDFYIVRLSNAHDFETALFDGRWMIGEHYLHRP